jgi:branched-chain amino acid transport system permease protein
LWAEILVLGTVQGAVLALLALGFSLIYGVGNVLNLAHGAFYLITLYVIYWCYAEFNLSLPISLVVGLIAVTIIGVITFVALIKPLQGTLMGVVLVTFALAFFFEQFVRVVYDPKTHYIPPVVPGSVSILGVTLLNQFVLTIIGAIVLIVAIMLFINKSKFGKSIRAVAQDAEAAKLMGINTDKVLMVCVALSALLAGAAAALYGPTNTFKPSDGWGFLLSAFAVTIFGGMGSLIGSLAGAFIMGYITTFTQYAPFLGPAWGELVPIIVILVMLLVRPQGLFGKKEVQ